MRTLIFGNCAPDRVFRILDPDIPTEADFELTVRKALLCAYPGYACFGFHGTFILDGSPGGHRPDLALVATDFSHWFVVEVELTSHSLEHHVLPQVRSFRFGTAQHDCVIQFAEGLGIDVGRAATMINSIPRQVAVVANRYDPDWIAALRGLQAQLLALSVFQTAAGSPAFELEGDLHVISKSLGFGRYLATDRSCKFTSPLDVPLIQLQIIDEAGTPSTWAFSRGMDATWATRIGGDPDLPDGCHVQLMRTQDGRLLLRRL